jgi:prepilin peptidase CpaA
MPQRSRQKPGLIMELQLLSLCIVSGLLLAATLSDLRTRRIPNTLVLYGMALALALRTLAPPDADLFPGSGSSLLAGLLGGLTGLGLLLPMYLLRALGAGDVKLMAMVGVWLGAQGVLQATLWTLLAGGVLSLAAALLTGTLRQVGRNLVFMVTAGVLRAVNREGLAVPHPMQPTGRLPYAVAIVSGTAFELVRLLAV